MIVLTTTLLKKVIPHAPQAIVDAFIKNQTKMPSVLADADSAALAFANVYAEVNGYSLPGLIENIRAYTPERMAQVWPNRFASGTAVRQMYGTQPGWQTRAFDSIYGGRMGNRPGTHDGGDFIGRGGPQITGRDGYEEMTKRIGVDLVNHPEYATRPELQPVLLEAFWDWKKLDRFVAGDKVDIVGARRVWNGGTNGLSKVQAEFKRLRPIFAGAGAEIVIGGSAGGVIVGGTTAAVTAGLPWYAIAAIIVVGIVITAVVIGLIVNHKKEKANVTAVISEPEDLARIPD